MIMQEEFNAAVNWCHDNGLVINASKTKMMHIRSPQFKSTQSKILVKNDACPNTPIETIEIVETYKYLGVIIDCHFLWSQHIDKLRMDLKKTLYALSHLQYYTTVPVLKQVYYALVESKLRYGILAWGNAATTHIQKIQKLQNTALKLINKGYTRNNESTFKTLNVEQIFKMTLILEYYDDNRFIRPIDHMINTRRRAQGMLKLPTNYNTYGRRQLLYSVPSTINELPRHLVNIENFKTRKKYIKNFFLNLHE